MAPLAVVLQRAMHIHLPTHGQKCTDALRHSQRGPQIDLTPSANYLYIFYTSAYSGAILGNSR